VNNLTSQNETNHSAVPFIVTQGNDTFIAGGNVQTNL